MHDADQDQDEAETVDALADSEHVRLLVEGYDSPAADRWERNYDTRMGL